MSRLTLAKRVLVGSALKEEISINCIVRMTGVAKHTVLEPYRAALERLIIQTDP